MTDFTDSEATIEETVSAAPLESTIATARLGFENFGKDRDGSTAFGWVVADKLAAELETRIAADAEPVENPLEGATASVVALSKWVDAANSHRDPEALDLHRVIKITEESGEVVSALIGALGANPRKGVTGNMDDVLKELLDVALTALGAYEHLDNHQGRSLTELISTISRVAQRAEDSGAVLES